MHQSRAVFAMWCSSCQKRPHGKCVPLFGICDKSNHFWIKFMSQSCQSYNWISANIVTIKIWPCLQRYTYTWCWSFSRSLGGGGLPVGRWSPTERCWDQQKLKLTWAVTVGGSMGSSGKSNFFCFYLSTLLHLIGKMFTQVAMSRVIHVSIINKYVPTSLKTEMSSPVDDQRTGF